MQSQVLIKVTRSIIIASPSWLKGNKALFFGFSCKLENVGIFQGEKAEWTQNLGAHTNSNEVTLESLENMNGAFILVKLVKPWQFQEMIFWSRAFYSFKHKPQLILWYLKKKKAHEMYNGRKTLHQWYSLRWKFAASANSEISDHCKWKYKKL